MADDFESKIRKKPFILIERILNPESNQFKDIEESSEIVWSCSSQGKIVKVNANSLCITILWLLF